MILQVFETTRNILDTRSITIGGLINITDTKERNGKSLRSLEENFYKAHGIKARQSALENYLETQVSNLYFFIYKFYKLIMSMNIEVINMS